MSDLLVLAVIGLGTYALRAGFMLATSSSPPGPLTRLLPHVGPAVLAAITVPALLAPRGTISFAETFPAAVAGAATWLLWRRSERLPVSLLGGLSVWWAVTAIVAIVA